MVVAPKERIAAPMAQLGLQLRIVAQEQMRMAVEQLAEDSCIEGILSARDNASEATIKLSSLVKQQLGLS